MMSSIPRTALITGASRGLGLALAQALAERGWSLIIDARGAAALVAARDSLAAHTRVTAIPGDVTDAAHREALVGAAQAAGGLDALVNNASILGPSPQPLLLDYPLDVLAEVYRANVIAPLALLQAVQHHLKPGARVINVTSDAGIEAYAGWGGYGSSKAALEQLSNILAAERPDWRVYWVDPGDMRTDLHQQAFPGEDISDRPLPEVSVPGLLALLDGELPSGRYRARELPTGQAAAQAPAPGVGEVRVALTVEDFAGAAALYRDDLHLPVVSEWAESHGRGLVLGVGRATLELLDSAQAAYVDQIEAGRRTAGPLRLALEVADVRAAAATLQRHGYRPLHEAVRTPWGHYNQRLEGPDGTQLTVFQEGDE